MSESVHVRFWTTCI